MSALKKLIHKRGQVKGKVTRFRTILEAYKPEEITDETERARSYEDIKERYETLEEIFKDFEEAHTEIAEARINANSPDLQTKLDEDEALLEEFETEYYQVRAEARIKLKAAQPPRTDQGNDNSSATNRSRVKLPEIKLPSFDGDYERWTEFKDAFTATIHDKSYLTDIEKFQYLRGQLTDEAAKVVSALSTTAENYKEAWDLLKLKYENKRLIINSHLRELLNVAEISKPNYAALNQLLLKIRSHTQALKVLGAPIEHWDMILIHIITNKMDFYSRTEWEKLIIAKKPEDEPTLKELLDYLTNRCQTLQILNKGKPTQDSNKTGFKTEKKVSLAATEPTKCVHCEGSHLIYKCDSFEKLDNTAKWNEVRRLRICGNCLKKGHISKHCKGEPCKICSRRHHTTLHQEINESTTQESSEQPEAPKGQAPPIVAVTRQEVAQESTLPIYDTSAKEGTTTLLHCAHRPKSTVILSTAEVEVLDVEGKRVTCRALLDPGSQLNLITSELAQRLRLPYKKTELPVSGVSQSQIKINNSVTVNLASRTSNFTSTEDYMILSKITERLPQVKINTTMLRIPAGLRLADPNFNVTGEIDILIGAGIFWKILCSGQISQEKHQPILQKTLLGWIIGGEQVTETPSRVINVCNLSIVSTLDDQMERWWRMEDMTKKEEMTPKEQYCEEQFNSTYERNNGRFKVKLPLDQNVKLGTSEEGACKRFYALEQRLKNNPKLNEEYTKFLQEYEKSGHMSKVVEETVPEPGEVYYLPHHPVIREESTTTKVRVVFDGSAKTSLNTSLNDKLLPGPNLQEEIINIILRFRLYAYVITGDIAQMFRQVEIAEEDRNYQRILWRCEGDSRPQAYVLNTVTYGTTCAPYLAMRCLRQLADDDGHKYPQAAEVLKRDFYMDDVLTGSKTIEEARDLQKQLYQLLHCGQFELQKWRANNPKILEHLSEECQTKKFLVVDKQEAVKTLGLLWNSSKDTFQFSMKLREMNKVTKRTILAAIAQIYDPMGFIGPALMHAKVIMQELWLLKLDWDSPVPQDVYMNWVSYYQSLEKINDLEIRRNVNPNNAAASITLHGFGDASEKGYGACIYALSYDAQGRANSALITSKSRVAPLKKITLPRLELCAALLLARLLDIVRVALGSEKIQDVFLWSDSTIVLYWLKTPPSQLKTFVANRVAEIQEITTDCTWLHVPSADNPADILSRGSTAEQMIASQLWWHGPRWISNKEEWPEQKLEGCSPVPEKKTTVMLLTANPTMETIKKFSSYKRLERVIAYCHRFIDAVRRKKRAGPLTVDELKRANLSIIRMTQLEAFPHELRDLRQGKALNHKSQLIMLKPFLDEQNIIRVGGRLQNADMTETQKHPIVLPSKHFVTQLIMRDMHLQLKHCGPGHLLSEIRNVYWPLAGRREARKITRRCIPCFKYKPRTCETMMADLPESRVKGITRPFDTTGVDYAGPLQIRESRRRGRIPITKGYIAVFTCFKTKAVHLELVTDLTTEAFLAALRRFIGRRGLCRYLYSDNATNFVGAARELREIYEFLSQKEEEISTKLAMQKITWKFIPPRAPHFGGLWEAAVKATKRHLYIITQGLTYTFEEYYTLLVEIEAILNSRPLTPLSSDPQDLTPLTPSHFLIGVSQLEPVAQNFVEVPDNHLTRWQHIQKLKQNFWRRWTKEYLHQLQSRSKWVVNHENIKVDTLVLLVDDNAAPLQWTLGRVTQVHPGADGIVRVASVKTSTGTFKRPVAKLCALPFDEQVP